MIDEDENEEFFDELVRESEKYNQKILKDYIIKDCVDCEGTGYKINQWGKQPCLTCNKTGKVIILIKDIPIINKDL